MKRLIIKKQDTETTYRETESETSESETEQTDDLSYNIDTNTNDVQAGGDFKPSYTRFVNNKYKIPKTGSIQDNLTREEILDKLDGYVPLRTLKQMEVLTTVPRFKTWVKYMNKETGKFRMGGLLMKTVYPKYIVLANSTNKLVWSVQLKDNIIFIRNPDELQKEKIENDKIEQIKDKLYDMYINGELKRN
jgi:hypothetical protein